MSLLFNMLSRLVIALLPRSSSVQFSHSVVSHTLWPHEPQHARPPYPSPTPPKPTSIVLVMPSNHLILHCPPLLLPSIFPSIKVFSNESALCIRWLKYWSFSFNISPFNEHPGLISLRMDWLDLLTVQGTLKSLPNTTVQKHQFFGAQPSSQSSSHICTCLLEKLKICLFWTFHIN